MEKKFSHSDGRLENSIKELKDLLCRHLSKPNHGFAIKLWLSISTIILSAVAMADINDASWNERCWVQKGSGRKKVPFQPHKSSRDGWSFPPSLVKLQVYKIGHKLTSVRNQDIINLTIKLMPFHRTRFWEQKGQMNNF